VNLTSINDYSLVAGAIRYDDPNSLGGVALKPAYWQPKLSLAPNVLGTEPDTTTFIAGISNTNDFAGQLALDPDWEAKNCPLPPRRSRRPTQAQSHER
jgi:hypothetical protein